MKVKLPPPEFSGGMRLNEALMRRRSIRDFSMEPLNLKIISQLLWSAQGLSDLKDKLRTSPSAGATFPLYIYVVIGDKAVKSNGDYLPAGIYRYDVHKHILIKVEDGDIRSKLSHACLGQEWVFEAPISIVIVAKYGRTTWRYGSRGIRYVHFEVGHVGQNIYLQCTSLGLGTVAVGAFDDYAVKAILKLSDEEIPLYVMPIGFPRAKQRVDPNKLRSFYVAED